MKAHVLTFLERVRGNKLAHLISFLMAGIFNLKVVEAEADEAVVVVAENDLAEPSSAGLDIGTLPEDGSSQVSMALSAINLGTPDVEYNGGRYGLLYVKDGLTYKIDGATIDTAILGHTGGDAVITNTTFTNRNQGQTSGLLQLGNNNSPDAVNVIGRNLTFNNPTRIGQIVEISGGSEVNAEIYDSVINGAGIGATVVNVADSTNHQSLLLQNVDMNIDNSVLATKYMTQGVRVYNYYDGDTEIGIKDSDIHVSGHGAAAAGVAITNRNVKVNVDDSVINVDGPGTQNIAIQLEKADAKVQLNNSEVFGADHGVLANGQVANAAVVTVDGGRLESGNGALIQGQSEAKLNVVAKNGSELIAGNGVLVNAIDQATVNLTVDGTDVSGDVTSDRAYRFWPADWFNPSREATTSANVTLQNQASLEGRTSQVDDMIIDSTSQWHMTANSDVHKLASDGLVSFDADNGFKTLKVTGDLSGAGTFGMNTDLASQQGDRLEVGGTISGSHKLAIADSGAEPVGAGGELMMVDGNGGDGTFSLHGRPYVDAGAFRYSLLQDGDDWYLRHTGSSKSDPEGLSGGANAALGNQAATSTLWSAQMNALHKRLGDLRIGKDDGGVWARGISKDYEVDNGSSRGFDQDVNGMELGADTAIPMEGGKLYVGGMVGTANSNQNFGDGSTGEIDSTLIGAYATWLDENGYYIDTVAKFNRMDNDVKTITNTGEAVKGSYKTDGYGVDVEVGKNISLKDGWFVQPQAELSWTRTNGADYQTTNGMSVDVGSANSLQGRLGVLAGKSLQLDAHRAIEPYVKASYVHEFDGNSTVEVNGNELDNKVAGSRVEVGAGAVMQVSEKTKVYVDAEHATGENVDEPWGVNLGVRFLW